MAHSTATTHRTIRARATMELKLSILSALNKLADRDTAQIAAADLRDIAQTLHGEGLPVFLNCLFDASSSDQKTVVCRECVKLFGALAAVHGDLLAPYLPKIVTAVVRRVRDPDSLIRDACVDAMGVLVARLYRAGNSNEAGGGLASGLSVFTKPLFEAMSEQSKTAQSGAAMCLARIVESVRDPTPGCFQRFLPRIIKLLCNSTFMAKASLLSVIASLARVSSPNGNQYLVPLVPCVQDSLQSSDWATRKAAADTLTLMGLVLGASISKFKGSTIAMLETYRFDKVKPVRDSMGDAIQVWRNIPDAETESPAVKGVTPNDAVTLTTSMQQLELTSPGKGHAPNEVGSISEKVVFAEIGVQNTHDNALANVSRKKSPLLTDKKLNLDFFRQIENRNQDDWQIEVAVPRASPSSEGSLPIKEMDAETIQVDVSGEEGIVRATVSGYRTQYGISPIDEKDSPKRRKDVSSESINSSKSNGTSGESVGLNIMSRSTTDKVQSNARLHADFQQRQDTGSKSTWDSAVPSKTSSGASQAGEHVTATTSDIVTIQRQLSHVEQGQCSLIEMVQDFVRSCQEGMLGLEVRVQRLERAVEDMARNLAVSQFGRVNGGGYLSLEAAAGCALPGNFVACSDPLSSRFQNTSEGSATFTQRLFAYGNLSSMGRGGREYSSKTIEMGPEMWNDPAGRALQSGFTGQHRSEIHSNLQRNHLMSFDDCNKDPKEALIDTPAPINRRAWERGSGGIPLGEGPSARSVWQASKDEATLAAIRVAGGDPRAAVLETEKKSPSNFGMNSSGGTSEASQSQTVEQGNGSSWIFWSHVIDDLHSGDVDSAYEQVLCAGDEFLLVRLMGKTGPVLDQLSSGTVAEVLHSVAVFLQQQSFLDSVLPWVQQVVDSIRANGPDYLNLTTDIKKELISALHEASTMDHSESILSMTMLKLAQNLGNYWSVCLDRNL